MAADETKSKMDSDKIVCNKTTGQSENEIVHSSAQQVVGSKPMVVEITLSTEEQAQEATNSDVMKENSSTQKQVQEAINSDVLNENTSTQKQVQEATNSNAMIENANGTEYNEVIEEAQQQNEEPEHGIAEPSAAASVILSNKGKHPVTFHKGYKYEWHSTNNGTEYNRCAT